MRTFCTFLAVFYFTPALTGMEWEQVCPYPTSAILTSVAHGGNIDVAGGETGIVYSEDSGKNWVRVAGRDAVGVTDLKYGNGVFVATTLKDGILRSTDGKTWHSQNVGLTNFYCLVLGNGLFVAGGAEGSIATSTDGAIWTVFPKAGASGFTIGVYGKGRFILKEFGNGAVVSTDGINWSHVIVTGIQNSWCVPPAFPPSPSCAGYQIMGLVFANGAFYAHVGWIGPGVNQSAYFTSADGLNWTEINGYFPLAGSRPVIETSYPGPSDLIFLNGSFLQLGYNGYYGFGRYGAYILSSSDLQTWKTNLVDSRVVTTVTISGSDYLAVGSPGTIARGASLDALVNEDNTQKFLGVVTAAAHGQTIVVAGRTPHGTYQGYPYPALVVSTNGGKTFDAPNVGFSFHSISTVRYIAGRFITTGINSEILSSTNGVDWRVLSPRKSEVQPLLFDIASDGQTWVAVGDSGIILTSTNGVDFVTANSGTTSTLYGVTYGSGMFIVCGNSSLLRSSNGLDWTACYPNGASSVAFGNDRFIAVAGINVYISTNAVDWTVQQVDAARFTRVAFAHGMFVAISDLTRVSHYSPDGITWLRRAVFGADLHDVSASDDTSWLCGDIIYGLNTQGQYEVGPFIFREREESPVAINSAAVTGNGFTLRLDSTPPANYRIYSADNIEGPWTSREVLTNVIGEISWQDSAAGVTRFYKIRQD